MPWQPPWLSFGPKLSIHQDGSLSKAGENTKVSVFCQGFWMLTQLTENEGGLCCNGTQRLGIRKFAPSSRHVDGMPWVSAQ
jgi:hypothetical protein